ncbi:MAG: hypothetical protein KF689_09655 [Gemmatimonadaceae bacterium]|nr:hypothetical protein [Gemmatimonadaceae bacterium]MCW5826136.1 hypothetical protein [Gemmatimonadaceae bacterium]
MSQTIPLGADARERFLLEIAAVVPPARVAEAHFFAPIRQGQIETGVCVIAALPEGAQPLGAEPEPVDGDASESAPAAESDPPFPEGASISSRHVVYSARYRWTRKGPERGKWDCEVVAEADAPLLTVEMVVQGVRQRANEPLEVERVEGDAVRAMIAEAQQRWPATA